MLVIFDGAVADGSPTPATGTEGTGTIARRLVNDLLASDPGAGAPTLTVVRGARPATLRLDAVARRYVVGRSVGAALRLVADEISRVHAVFTCDCEGVTVADLASKNGVHVNGRRVVTQTLRDGDIVEIGPIALRLDDPAARYLRALEALADVAQADAAEEPDRACDPAVPDVPEGAQPTRTPHRAAPPPEQRSLPPSSWPRSPPPR